MQRGGPFGDAAEVGDLLTSLDCGAIDVTEDDRRDLARGDADHRFVDEPQSVGDPTRVDREPALGAQPEREQVGISVSRPLRTRFRRRRGRGRQVARSEVSIHVQERDVAMLDRVALQLVEKSLGSGGPAARRAGSPPVPKSIARWKQQRIAPVDVARRKGPGETPLRELRRCVSTPEQVGRERGVMQVVGTHLSGSTSDQTSRAAVQSPRS